MRPRNTRTRITTRLMVTWVAAFVVILGFWLWGESTEPGQQYADPLIPCAYLAMLAAPPLSLLWLVADIVAAWLDAD